MQNNTKLRLMLVVVALLAGIKFGLLPVLAWQNETVEEIKSIERRNAKAQALVDHQQQLFMALTENGKAYKAKAESFPVYPDKTSFRLEAQIMFDQILKQDQLRSKRFFWRDSEDTQVLNNLYKASFNVTFTGLAKDFALWHSKLVNNYPQFRVPNMMVMMSNHSDKSLGVVDVTLTVEAYYWLGGIQ